MAAPILSVMLCLPVSDMMKYKICFEFVRLNWEIDVVGDEER